MHKQASSPGSSSGNWPPKRTHMFTHRSKILGQCNLQKGSSIQKWPPGLHQLLPRTLPFFFCWGTYT